MYICVCVCVCVCDIDMQKGMLVCSRLYGPDAANKSSHLYLYSAFNKTDCVKAALLY